MVIIGTQDLIRSNSCNEWRFEKTAHCNRSNGQFLLGFIFPCIIFLARATISLHLGIFNLPWLREIAIAFYMVASYQSNRLTSQGITRWQTVVLLSSMLCIIMATANLASWFPVFVLIVLLVVVSTALNQSSVSLTEPDSSSARLFVNSALCIDCCNYSLSAKYEHVQNRSNVFEREEKCAF